MVFYQSGIDLQSLLTSLLEQDHFTSPLVDNSFIEARCPGCGLTYRELRKNGRLGCAKCYQAFNSYLEPMLNQIHGTVRHTGKVLEKSPVHRKLNRKLKDLQLQLKQAVKDEAYEKAAAIRDEIQKLSKEGEGRE